jgi:hypothetical protein
MLLVEDEFDELLAPALLVLLLDPQPATRKSAGANFKSAVVDFMACLVGMRDMKFEICNFKFEI